MVSGISLWTLLKDLVLKAVGLSTKAILKLSKLSGAVFSVVYERG